MMKLTRTGIILQKKKDLPYSYLHSLSFIDIDTYQTSSNFTIHMYRTLKPSVDSDEADSG
jgi:hypothetical protein